MNDTGNLFAEQEQGAALLAHREAWRVCWNWRGPEVGGYCSVDSCCAEKEDGGLLYCYTEECRLIEQRPDGKWLAVIEMGEVHGKPWHKDGTRLVLGEFDIWPPVRRLKAARASNNQAHLRERSVAK